MKNDKEQPMSVQEFSEELFDKYGYYIDDNLSAMEMVTGCIVVMQNDFMSACTDVANWQASQHSYTEKKFTQDDFQIIKAALNNTSFVDEEHNFIKEGIYSKIANQNKGEFKPTYTQEQMIAFGEDVLKEASKEASSLISKEQILSIDISKLLNK